MSHFAFNHSHRTSDQVKLENASSVEASVQFPKFYIMFIILPLIVSILSSNIECFYLRYVDRSCPHNSEELWIYAPVCISQCSQKAQDHGSSAFSLQTTGTDSCVCKICSFDTSIINTGDNLFIGKDGIVLPH